jgi:hypothetical protein
VEPEGVKGDRRDDRMDVGLANDENEEVVGKRVTMGRGFWARGAMREVDALRERKMGAMRGIASCRVSANTGSEVQYGHLDSVCCMSRH